jgi:UDP-3-O-acyl-N-acetylglucosamine deacetylase
MEYVAKLIGMTVEELKDFYIEKVNEARTFGFTEEEAKKIVQETFRKNLGL